MVYSLDMGHFVWLVLDDTATFLLVNVIKWSNLTSNLLCTYHHQFYKFKEVKSTQRFLCVLFECSRHRGGALKKLKVHRENSTEFISVAFLIIYWFLDKLCAP